LLEDLRVLPPGQLEVQRAGAKPRGQSKSAYSPGNFVFVRRVRYIAFAWFPGLWCLRIDQVFGSAGLALLFGLTVPGVKKADLTRVRLFL
jgi:hypothetical protein